jgi:metallo-beta-lactamase class B
MKTIFSMALLVAVLLGLSNFLYEESLYQVSDASRSFYDRRTSDHNLVELTKISDNIWVHTTYSDENGTRTPSNGLVALTSNGAILVDTPWNDEQTEELLVMVSNIFKKDIRVAIITHAHEDRIGGISTLMKNGIDVRSTGKTALAAEKAGFLKPQPSLDLEPAFTIEDVEVEVFYPGEGHTADNVTVWFPKDSVLFGGCLIKSLDSQAIGNVEDANLEAWPKSILNVMDRYAHAIIIVPGHGILGDSDLMGKTWELVSQ